MSSFCPRRGIAVLAVALAAVLAAPAPAPAQKAAVSMSVEVDLTDAPRKFLQARMHIPARPGRLTLYYPKWIPGEHGPTGPITDLAGLKIAAAGKPVAWKRDEVDMY